MKVALTIEYAHRAYCITKIKHNTIQSSTRTQVLEYKMTFSNRWDFIHSLADCIIFKLKWNCSEHFFCVCVVVVVVACAVSGDASWQVWIDATVYHFIVLPFGDESDIIHKSHTDFLNNANTTAKQLAFHIKHGRMRRVPMFTFIVAFSFSTLTKVKSHFNIFIDFIPLIFLLIWTNHLIFKMRGPKCRLIHWFDVVRI